MKNTTAVIIIVVLIILIIIFLIARNDNTSEYFLPVAKDTNQQTPVEGSFIKLPMLNVNVETDKVCFDVIKGKLYPSTPGPMPGPTPSPNPSPSPMPSPSPKPSPNPMPTPGPIPSPSPMPSPSPIPSTSLISVPIPYDNNQNLQGYDKYEIIVGTSPNGYQYDISL